MFFFLSLLVACAHDNSLPIFSDTPKITIQSDAQEQRLDEVVVATQRAWKSGEKAKAQLIFKSYYVNEFRKLEPQLRLLGASDLADIQYGLGLFIIDIPTIEVPSKFESRLQAQVVAIKKAFAQIPSPEPAPLAEGAPQDIESTASQAEEKSH